MQSDASDLIICRALCYRNETDNERRVHIRRELLTH